MIVVLQDHSGNGIMDPELVITRIDQNSGSLFRSEEMALCQLFLQVRNILLMTSHIIWYFLTPSTLYTFRRHRIIDPLPLRVWRHLWTNYLKSFHMAWGSILVTFEIVMTSNIFWHFWPLHPTNMFVLKRLMYCPLKTLDPYPLAAES